MIRPHSPPLARLGFSFSVFLSRMVHLFLGDLSEEQPSASEPLPPGDGGPLKEASREGLLVEEQREELRLVSGRGWVPRGLWPSLSVLQVEQTSWPSLTWHRDTS